MTFLRSVRAAFRNYFQFSGRATRAEFWWFAVFAGGIGAALLGLNVWFDGRMIEVDVSPSRSFGYVSYAVLWGVIVLSPTLAVTVRRLRDAGRDSQELLWILLPLIGWLVLAVRLCAPSVPAARFGGPDLA